MTRLGFASVTICLAAACATIPQGRYGVERLTLSGVQRMDEHALRACLATRERDRLSLDLSRAPNPACGVPPFDARHLRLEWWSWPWTDWPLYEPSVFERDLARIERWYRARGYYKARVVRTEATPPAALYGTPTDTDHVRLHVEIEEGEPVRVSGVSVRGLADLDDELADELFHAPDMALDSRFDEAVYSLNKARLLRILRNAGYAYAKVIGHVEIDPRALTAEVEYEVRPGPFTELGRVCIQGYGELPAKLVLQASGLVPGAPFRQRELEDARTRIYQLRVFSEVEVRVRRRPAQGGAPSGDAREGEWVAWESDDAGRAGAGGGARLCRAPEASSAHRRVPVEIRVKPGRLYRYGVGAGFQVGLADGEQKVSESATQQWDLHLMAFLEVRNFLGGLRRLRIEERPRLIFPEQFPRLPPQGERRTYLGNSLQVNLTWPAFLEDRTLLRVLASADTGPDPYGGRFFRNDVSLLFGPERDFVQNHLRLSFQLGFNLYKPTERAYQQEAYSLYFLRQLLEWDTRDDPGSPTRGVLARLELHESTPPSRWLYLRAAPELRLFIPLPLGLVVALRAGVGALWIYEPENLADDRDRLGPRPYRFRGGGPYSVRGVRSGALGLVDPTGEFPGGTRSWIASAELRVPLGESFGVVLFSDAGDVDAGEGADADGGPRAPRFRFDQPHLTLGAGLRYKTLVGPVRLDVGWLVPGAYGDAPRLRDPWFGFNGGVHLTVGEAF